MTRESIADASRRMKSKSTFIDLLDSESRKNLEALKTHYGRHPLVVYTGAGVSKGDNEARFGLPGWWGLLEKVLDISTKRNRGKKTLSGDPWKAADLVVSKCGSKSKFQRILVSVVQARQNYTNSQRQLSRSFLTLAPTLNAVTAFCAELRGQVEDVLQPRYDVGPNPRIRAILTSNYDSFLEAGFSTKFIKPLLKPVAAFGSSAGRIDQIPVFHVHGYVPHPSQRLTRKRRPLVKQLVLTNDDYKKAWNRRDAFGPTMTPQIHYLRHYTVLFVGFSFTDKYVCNLLRELRREYSLSQGSHKREHFALIPAALFETRGSEYFRRMGIRTLIFREFGEIPTILGELYTSALMSNRGLETIQIAWVDRKTHHLKDKDGPRLKIQECWKILLDCRNGALPFFSELP
jgi:hypothetical protein